MAYTNHHCSYILNRGWVDRTAQRHPTYAEITTSEPQRERSRDGSVKESSKQIESQPQLGEAPEGELEMIEEEDEFDDLNDRFESSYNFRFEEP
jgi:protein KRI1